MPHDQDAQITLAEVTRENWRAALTLGVAPDQQRFVSDYAPIAALGLAKAYIRPGGLIWLPLAMSARDERLPDGALVGFVMLAYDVEDAEVCSIFHFFLDARYQGHGYAGAALRALLALIRERLPRCSTIQLTVHPENERAQRLYRGAGFRATGDLIDGEPLYALRWEPV
ncbi:MAG: GNAT family N-acetyltransferase [Ktedonobacterales bacterium]